MHGPSSPFSALLGGSANVQNFPRANRRNYLPRGRHEGEEMLQLQSMTYQHHHTKVPARERLLVFEATVGCHEHLKTGFFSTTQQLTIQHPGPTLGLHGPHVVTRQLVDDLARQVLV